MQSHPTAFTSLEFYPPRTTEGVQNLRSRILRMKENTSPVFMDVTWGAGGSTSETTMDLVRYIKECGCVANMHLTCTNMDPDLVKSALSDCRKYGEKKNTTFEPFSRHVVFLLKKTNEE